MLSDLTHWGFWHDWTRSIFSSDAQMTNSTAKIVRTRWEFCWAKYHEWHFPQLSPHRAGEALALDPLHVCYPATASLMKPPFLLPDASILTAIPLPAHIALLILLTIHSYQFSSLRHNILPSSDLIPLPRRTRFHILLRQYLASILSASMSSVSKGSWRIHVT